MNQRRSRQKPLLRQTEMFDPEERSTRPAWSDIPVHARTAVTELVARMLRQDRNRAVPLEEEEVGHE